jgi:uncharacterized protein (DUF4213/DUF364 family)
MLLDELTDRILSRSPSGRVVDFRAGLGYTAAQLDDGRCGVAYTFREAAKEGCCVIREAGSIAGRPTAEVADWAKSADPIMAAAGLSTMNALVDPPATAVESDLLASLDVEAGDVIGMVGFFGPLIGPLRVRCRRLHVFERQPGEGVLPEAEAKELLPRCNVVLLTATTILNRTIDELLGFCEGAREIAVLGPSTPFVPEVFRSRSVTLLSGVQVVDAGRVLRIVSEGGGTRQLGGAVRKLTLRIDTNRLNR